MTHIYVSELIRNQLQSVPIEWKLEISDMERIAEKISASIFGEECSLWLSYVQNTRRKHKGMHVSFFFHSCKVNLLRLLWLNYVGCLDNMFVKCNCNNMGRCLNIKHYYTKAYKIPINRGCPKVRVKPVKVIFEIVDPKKLTYNVCFN